MLYDISTYRIVRAKTADDGYIEKHSHSAYFHYMYILNGSGHIIIDGHELEVSKYDLVMAPPGIEHEIFGKDELIKLDIKFAAGNPLYRELLRCGYYIHGLSSHEDKLMRDMFDEAVNALPMYSYAIDSKLLELLCLILRRDKRGIEMLTREQKSNDFLPDTDNISGSGIEAAVNYIKQHINKNISIAELAAYIGYSESYFSTAFKRCTGYTPNRYINILKIEKAKELIMYTPSSITAIAAELGFESVHYFSKVFKQISGISPTNYVDRSSLDMIVNVLKNEPSLPPEDRYEIPVKHISERNTDKHTKH